VTGADLGDIDLEITRQTLDHIVAQPIVRRQPIVLGRWQFAP
jgi:hypothetical protein